MPTTMRLRASARGSMAMAVRLLVDTRCSSHSQVVDHRSADTLIYRNNTPDAVPPHPARAA